VPFIIDDLKNIKDVARREDAFELLSRSFAPSICGHDKVKKGLLLQLIGGTEKNLQNGMHLRGDVNILLVGDPSCGKSQMLRFVMNIAPLAISTTGRGSSGVGLTAAMVREPGQRDFTVEAGAMVLADRGTICIDEFDKMNLADRVAIHEAMEQQVVTISKAGMHITLNARCSVLAAANPTHGNFDPSKDLAANIGMPDSLLSRFDLVYIVRDLTDETIDKKIATQVLAQARYRHGGEQRRGVEQIHSSIIERREQADVERPQEATDVFQKRVGDIGGDVAQVLTVDFLRKYVTFCQRLKPVLSEEAQQEISERYVEMRRLFQMGYTDTRDPNAEQKPRLAVTTRTLEALIRLSTAHAKLKLRKDEVLKEDVQVAYRLMLLAREEEKAEEEADVGGQDDGDAGGDDGVDGNSGGEKRRLEDGEAAGAPPAKVSRTSITTARYRVLETLVSRTFARIDDLLNLSQGELLEEINRDLVAGEDLFSEGEFAAGLKLLEDANKVMVTDDGSVARIS
jgi:DNA replication licensing factor MCM3